MDRSETPPPAPTPDEVMPGAGLVDDRPPAAAPVADHGVHLSTASKISPDGVAARTTRLDGTVKLGATDKHQLLTLGVPLAAAVLLIGGVVGTYRIGASVAEAEERAAQVQVEVDTAAVTQTRSAVVLLDLDGCGVIDQATGFLFADQTILVPREAVLTDHRPTVVTDDGTSHTAVITGWSVTRDIAVIRADDRLAGGLRWGVSSRVRAGDSVSLLAVTGSGIATPVATTIETANTLDGRNVTFELGTSAAQGSVVLDGDGFVIGVVGADGLAQASDDLSPAISRIVLDNERPQSVCPPPPTTLPPTTVPTEDGADGATGEDAGAADKGAATGGDTDG